ncbi:Putative E3 ubiquitin ligase complex SCF subunit scon-2 [Verticillium dahliae VDG1]|nr:Putative E3 ubiquitin ligase complex SCF subunit scon-2 [Verticillium dahliae VDG1]
MDHSFDKTHGEPEQEPVFIDYFLDDPEQLDSTTPPLGQTPFFTSAAGSAVDHLQGGRVRHGGGDHAMPVGHPEAFLEPPVGATNVIDFGLGAAATNHHDYTDNITPLPSHARTTLDHFDFDFAFPSPSWGPSLNDAMSSSLAVAVAVGAGTTSHPRSAMDDESDHRDTRSFWADEDSSSALEREREALRREREELLRNLADMEHDVSVRMGEGALGDSLRASPATEEEEDGGQAEQGDK